MRAQFSVNGMDFQRHKKSRRCARLINGTANESEDVKAFKYITPSKRWKYHKTSTPKNVIKRCAIKMYLAPVIVLSQRLNFAFSLRRMLFENRSKMIFSAAIPQKKKPFLCPLKNFSSAFNEMCIAFFFAKKQQIKQVLSSELLLCYKLGQKGATLAKKKYSP